MKIIKIDIYNFILNKLNKILHFKSRNIKYNPKIVFDSVLYILNSNVSWNSKIIINDNFIHTNSIYKHLCFLTKINFFQKILCLINNKFFKSSIKDSLYCSAKNIKFLIAVDSIFIANKNCSTKYKNLKQNPNIVLSTISRYRSVRYCSHIICEQ
jgi:hypothetical protein